MTQLTFQRKHLGVAAILSLMALTLYLTFAFPIDLFKVRQTDTTIIKSVQILVRHGDKAPTPASYFLGEKEGLVEPSDGFGRLTLAGKRRMYSLGKFLKMKYYDLLLNGDPNKLYVRSSDSDRCLESASILVSGLNPPSGRWVWSEELPNWQPNAVHTMPEEEDDLLYPYAACPAADDEEERIRNSSEYVQYLNEYKHDLQTLYDYTGNDKVFTDLTQAEIINDALKTRLGMPMEPSPVWYTTEFAKRLDYIADKTDQIRFSTPLIQRLRSGRLLYEIIQNIKTQIGSGGSTVASGQADRRNVQVYVSHDQTLIALMNSLQIYTGIPNYGSGIVIELHYDPVNLIHFLRFYMIGSQNPDIIPQPVRINPSVCGANPECDPLQLEQNLQHLTIDTKLWLQACRIVPGQLSIVEPIVLPVDTMPSSVSPIEDMEAPSSVAPNDDTDSPIEGNSMVPTGADGVNLLVGPSIQPPVLINGDSADTSSEKPLSPTSDQHTMIDTQEASDSTLNEISVEPVSEEPSSSDKDKQQPSENSSEPTSAPPSKQPETEMEEEEELEEEEAQPVAPSLPPGQTDTPIQSHSVPFKGTDQIVTPTTTTTPAPSTSANGQENIVEQNKNEPGSGDTNKLRPLNQIDNGIAISPMMKNFFKNGEATSETVTTHHRGIRPNSITTRDVFVPMEDADQSNGAKSKTKKTEGDFEAVNEIPLE